MNTGLINKHKNIPDCSYKPKEDRWEMEYI